MKIIHVLSGLTKGGGERIVAELANKAVEKGDEVTIVAGWHVDPAYMQNSIDPRVNIKFVSKKKFGAYLKIMPWILRNKKWICSHDVLHCHLTYGAVFGSIANFILKKISRKKTPVIVETYHAVGMPIPKFNRWAHSRAVLMRNGLVLMAKDPYWENFIRMHPRLKVSIIPNGISLPGSKTEIISSTDPKKKGKYLVGTISMLRPDRKPTLYVPIFQDIHKAFENNVDFILGGGGIEFDKIKELIEAAGLSAHVQMPGLVNDPPAVISNMDIYVSVCVGETAGISMVEAALCKVPVVGIQMTEDYQAKPGDWFWSHIDTREVAKKIIFLLQNLEERKALAEQQYKYVNENLTTEAMYGSYASFYKELLRS